MDQTSLGNIRKATTIIKSGAYALSASINNGSLRLVGCNKGSLCCSENSFTADLRSCRPLPEGLSGAVTTAITFKFSVTIFFKQWTANAGVPKKIMFRLISDKTGSIRLDR